MKYRINKLAFLIFFAGLFITACDKVDNPVILINEQDIPLDEKNFISDTILVTQKQVFLEDFTGHTCTNCPTAAITAHGWIEDYDHRLVIIGIHAGNFAAVGDDPYTTDFTCPTSVELFNFYEVSGNPSGMINRVEHDQGVVLPFFGVGEWWLTAVESELAKDNLIDLKVINDYSPEDNAVKVSTYATFNQQLEGKFKLVIFIVEDHIISAQKNDNPDLPGAPDDDDWLDYEHRNVLRDALNGTFGTYISADGTILQGEEYFAENYYIIDDEWVTANCNIIAFIFHEESQEIIQVAELGIKTEE